MVLASTLDVKVQGRRDMVSHTTESFELLEGPRGVRAHNNGDTHGNVVDATVLQTRTPRHKGVLISSRLNISENVNGRLKRNLSQKGHEETNNKGIIFVLLGQPPEAPSLTLPVWALASHNMIMSRPPTCFAMMSV